jgi:iron complex transport system substrate-binding protein
MSRRHVGKALERPGAGRSPRRRPPFVRLGMRAAATAVLLAVALAAVSGAAVSGAAVSGAAAGAASGSGPFPVTIDTPAGKVTITHRPTRVISLSPSATEDLFAIGAGHQVVAVDDDSDYPPDAPRTKLSGYTPDVEAIARYKPDLVVISYDTALVASLGKLGIPVVYQDAPDDIAGAYADIAQLGQATGNGAAASRLVRTMRNEVSVLVARSPRLATPPSYYYELDPTYYSVTSSTFVGSILALFHLRDIADAAKGASSGYPQLSEEYIVKADPQLIFLADTGADGGQTAASVARRPGWGAVAAVAQHDVFTLDDDIASRWGPRLVDLVASVEQALTAYRHHSR